MLRPHVPQRASLRTNWERRLPEVYGDLPIGAPGIAVRQVNTPIVPLLAAPARRTGGRRPFTHPRLLCTTAFDTPTLEQQSHRLLLGR